MTPALNEAIEALLSGDCPSRIEVANLVQLIQISEAIERRKGRMQVGDIVTQYLAESDERGHT